MTNDTEMMPKVNEIMTTQLSEVDKLAQAFNYLMGQYIEAARHDQELQKALGDKDAFLKLKIRGSTLEYALGMFQDCYRRATGRSMLNERG